MQQGDFKPNVLKSTDRGKTWTSIAANLPERDCVWCLAEDHVNKDLLFAGTEFGLYFTVDGGKQWVQLRGGVPTIPFRDIIIQRREGDLVCATFGRGFFVLDDIAPLRHLTPKNLAKEGVLFPVRKAYNFKEQTKDVLAAGSYAAANPPRGAVFTYFLREPWAKDVKVVLTVTDSSGTMTPIAGTNSPGINRVSWEPEVVGKAARFQVSLGKQVGTTLTAIGESQSFEVVPLVGGGMGTKKY